ncbi:LuxR C-terminal-related transcriptional regulator, partial [Yersinia rohdei]
GFVDSLSLEQEMLASLSSQEIKVLRFLLSGADNMQIAAAMFISNKTVSTYKRRLMEKLGCGSLADLLAFANRNKIG